MKYIRDVVVSNVRYGGVGCWIRGWEADFVHTA